MGLMMHMDSHISLSNGDDREFTIWHFEPNRTSNWEPESIIRNLFYFWHLFQNSVSWIVLWYTMNESTVTQMSFSRKEFDLIMDIGWK
jgi:hypothetical protein